ncbi:tetraspanin-33-like [Ptychodera flava]|uniref:tetraspanin-33-like n=1 Tax=Ptychodera flava TaxID=63121 RepID=UPI00396A22CA
MSDESAVNPVIKYLLFAFNFIFWVVGFLMLGLGIWATVEKGVGNVMDYLDLLTDPAIVLIVVGAVIFIIGFAGCVGAIRENTFFLMFFYLFLALILLLELVAGIVAIVFAEETYNQVDIVVQRAIVRYRSDPDLRNFIDFVQVELKCCGGKGGYQDWSNNMYFNCSDSNPSRERCGVPYSCCRPEDNGNNIINTQCGYDTTNKPTTEVSDIIYISGCVAVLVQLVNNNVYLIGGLAIGFAIVQIIGIFLARTLHSQIDEQRRRHERGKQQNLSRF